MAGSISIGLRTKIVLSLAVVMTLFIILTELSVSQLVRVSMARSNVESVDPGIEGSDHEQELNHLRRLILFYMVTGALVAIVLGALAITRSVVRPLSRVTRAVERVARGDLATQVPIAGSGELIELGVNFNKMTRTLRDQQEELKQQVVALETSSSDLKSAQDSLIRAAKLASVGTLAAGVAHEIGNPIAGVLGLLDALEDEPDEEQRQRYHALIRKEVERIDRIIGELLAYARPVRGSSDEVLEGPSSCDPAEVMEHVISLLRAQRLFDKVDLVVDMEEGLTAAVPRDEMTQLMVNLLLNAGQAMEGRGVITVVGTSLEQWRPALAVVSRPATRIVVTDDGPGVPAEIAPKVFDPFFTNRDSGQGSGLGLSICQSICERVGGEIVLVRDHQGGARFAITLPR